MSDEINTKQGLSILYCIIRTILAAVVDPHAVVIRYTTRGMTFFEYACDYFVTNDCCAAPPEMDETIVFAVRFDRVDSTYLNIHLWSAHVYSKSVLSSLHGIAHCQTWSARKHRSNYFHVLTCGYNPGNDSTGNVPLRSIFMFLVQNKKYKIQNARTWYAIARKRVPCTR